MDAYTQNVLAAIYPPGATYFSLTVIPCGNYTHKSKYTLPVAPSPNLPEMQSVYWYPVHLFFRRHRHQRRPGHRQAVPDLRPSGTSQKPVLVYPCPPRLCKRIQALRQGMLRLEPKRHAGCGFEKDRWQAAVAVPVASLPVVSG
jgi:hypothetical protein